MRMRGLVVLGVGLSAALGGCRNNDDGSAGRPADPIVRFAAANQAASEAPSREVRVFVTVSPAPAQAVSVPFTVSGSASGSAGGDYTVVTPSPLVVPAGQTSGEIVIALIDDAADESEETIVVRLGEPTPGQRGTPAEHTIALTSNDSPSAVHGLTGDGRLVRFDANAPDVLAGDVAITGLVADEAPVGIDFRTADGSLLLLTDRHRIYTLDPATGAAGAMRWAELGDMAVQALDFDPVRDRLRVLGAARENLQLDPDDGAILARDGDLAYADDDPRAAVPPVVEGLAYTQGSGGATTAFVIDSGLDQLATLGSPNGTPQSPDSGRLLTVGNLGRPVGETVGFDIDPARPTGFGYLVEPLSAGSDLFQVNLASGAARRVGAVGAGLQVIDIAIRP